MTDRSVVVDARRVVVKVGSSSLTTAEGGIDPHRISALVDVLAAAFGPAVPRSSWCRRVRSPPAWLRSA